MPPQMIAGEVKGANMVTATGIRALVIGNYRSRSTIVHGLQRNGFDVVEAMDCLPFLKHLVDERPNIVVISTARTDDYVIRLLRAARCLTTVPIVVVGPGIERDVVRSLLNGADAYLPRSCSATATPAYVQALLNRN